MATSPSSSQRLVTPAPAAGPVLLRACMGRFIASLVLHAAVLLLLTAAPCHAEEPAFRGYDEGAYLQQWISDTFPTFPAYLWNTDFPPCQGFLGVTCNSTAGGASFVSAIDLSATSLPSHVRHLTGQLQDPPLFCGLLYLDSVNLAGNNLSGTIPASLSYCPALERLNLEGNNLSGNISRQLCSLPLKCLSLQNNNLTGSIPSCLSSFPCVDFQGNPFLDISEGSCNASATQSSCYGAGPAKPVYAPPSPPASSSSGLSPLAVALIVVGSLAGLLLVLASLALWKHYQRKREQELRRRQLIARIESEVSSRNFGELHRFSADELAEASDWFSLDNIVGEGGTSTVYKGVLADGRVVAIKKWKTENAREGAEVRFLNEVEFISVAKHKNLAHCLGYCLEHDASVSHPVMMLVLRFYSNGSVASRTRGKEGNPLGWEARKAIARGAAEGVAYLHVHCDPPIIHKDIKAENILLDEQDRALVSDFGLATESTVDETHRTTAVQGTLGHIAPEYLLQGRCSVRSDVYAFGVFLLELVSGRDIFSLALDTQSEQDEGGLHSWLTAKLQSSGLEDLVDNGMRKSMLQTQDFLSDQVTMMLHVALVCVHPDPGARPSMGHVLKMLAEESSELSKKWEMWSETSSSMTREEFIRAVQNPDAWENMSSGIRLTPAILEHQRR